MIKYNLKKILIEEDELDLVDTSFFSKYDKVPDRDQPGRPGEDSPEWEEYHDDLRDHVKDRLTDYVKNNPDVVPQVPSAFIAAARANPSGWFNNYTSPTKYWIKKYMDHRWNMPVVFNGEAYDWNPDHIKYSRADTWIKEFHDFLDPDYQAELAAQRASGQGSHDPWGGGSPYGED